MGLLDGVKGRTKELGGEREDSGEEKADQEMNERGGDEAGEDDEE
jgi:hypothetical protein